MANCRWLSIFALATVVAPGLSSETHCPGNVASVPLRHVNRYQMIVAVSVNHSGPFDFLLDTGTQVTIVEPSLAGDLQLNTDGSAAVAGVGFQESVPIARLEALAVGAHADSGYRVLVSELDGMKLADLHVRGILGEDFLQRFDMLIDNAHGLLCLDDANVMRGEVKGQHIPLLPPAEMTTGAPPEKSLIMSVRLIDGMRAVRLKLDSGSNTPFLYGPSEYLALGVVKGDLWHGTGAKGAQQFFDALPPQDMKISGVALSRVQFLALRNERKGSHLRNYDGLLPTGLFRQVFVSRNGEFAVLEPKS